MYVLWYLEYFKLFVLYGYIVVDMFYGDGCGVVFYVNMVLCLFYMCVMIDFFLEYFDFVNVIDVEWIGVVGYSVGGYIVFVVLGGIDFSGKFLVVVDLWIKVGFMFGLLMGGGLVMGLFKLGFWFFGINCVGFCQVWVFFFVVYGEKD